MDNIKAIFMDLDGTVLTSGHKVSKNLIKKLRELEGKRVKTFVATGRTFSSSKPFVEMLGIKNPVINYNGGRVVNPLNALKYGKMGIKKPRSFLITSLWNKVIHAERHSSIW